ncbi:hypothetical protein SAMN00777080_3976 [Aquiflexum balticum DSM 16537]|uniref:Uncharacterized protein n=1 Tax=Aquiflexum balticum DSM 16537 TaxID=758820 RepID=A0A1W2H8Z7_9BACT|nr:hypothetical protein SAMN00777080_3976 [Aquiflexum balticum DSM 16537]
MNSNAKSNYLQNGLKPFILDLKSNVLNLTSIQYVEKLL